MSVPPADPPPPGAPPPAGRPPLLGPLLWLLIGGLCVIRGAVALRRAQAPVADLPCAEALARPSLAGPRARLRGCRLHLDGATVELDRGRVVAAWVPLRADGPLPGRPALLLRDQDPARMALLTEALDAEAQGAAAHEAWVRAKMAELRPAADLDGRVLDGVERSAEDRHHLGLHEAGLAEAPTVFAPGPAGRAWLGWALGGVLMMGLGGLGLGRPARPAPPITVGRAGQGAGPAGRSAPPR